MMQTQIHCFLIGLAGSRLNKVDRRFGRLGDPGDTGTGRAALAWCADLLCHILPSRSVCELLVVGGLVGSSTKWWPGVDLTPMSVFRCSPGISGSRANMESMVDANFYLVAYSVNHSIAGPPARATAGRNVCAHHY